MGTQTDTYHQEISALRQQMLNAETQLRQLTNLATSHRDRDKTSASENVVLQQQEVLQNQIESHLHLIHELTQQIFNIDPTELVPTTTEKDDHDTTETIIKHTTHLQVQQNNSSTTVVDVSFSHDQDRESDSEVKELTSTDVKSLVYEESNNNTSVQGRLETSAATVGLPLSWADIAAGRRSPNPQSFSDETIQLGTTQSFSRPQSQAASRPQSETASRPTSQAAATSSQITSRPQSQSKSKYSTPIASPKPRKRQPFRDPDAEQRSKDTQSLDRQDKKEGYEKYQKSASYHKTDEKPPVRERKFRQNERQQQFSKSPKSQSFEQDAKTRRYHDRKDQNARQKDEGFYYQENTKSRKNVDDKNPQNIASRSNKHRDRSQEIIKQRDGSQETNVSKQVPAKRSPLKKSHSEDSHDKTSSQERPTQPIHSIWGGKKTYAEILKGQLEAAAAAQAMQMSKNTMEKVHL